MEIEDSDRSDSSQDQIDLPDRKALKLKRREQRHQAQVYVLIKFKQRPYFNQQQNEQNKKLYYSKIIAPSGKEGYTELNKLIFSTFQHARRRMNLFPIVERHPDYTLRCVYTNKILETAEGKLLQKCDQQHSFPQSYQKGKKSGTGRDMHSIFAASKNANGSRGNKPFGKISQKIVRDDERGTVYLGKNFNTYVPKYNVGAVCRSTLYVLVCYINCANNEKFPKQLLPWIVDKAANQPVTLWQKHRNAELFELQKNRNPFVDYPQWAKDIDFQQGWQQQ